jgi:hypothetical protein
MTMTWATSNVNYEGARGCRRLERQQAQKKKGSHDGDSENFDDALVVLIMVSHLVSWIR